MEPFISDGKGHIVIKNLCYCKSCEANKGIDGKRAKEDHFE